MIPRQSSVSGRGRLWRAAFAALWLALFGTALGVNAIAHSQVVSADQDANDDGGQSTFTPAETEADLSEAHRAYLKNRDLQLERPEREIELPDIEELPEMRETPGWLKAIGSFFDGVFTLLGPLFQILFWLVVIGVIGAMLYFIFSEMARARWGDDGRDKSKPGDDVIVDVRPDEATARTLLEEADALAKAGKFAEAVHLLLFRSIEDIQSRLEGGVPRSMTAREIGGLGLLPDRARQALSPIIRIVERSFFGGQDVDEGGWTQARASYQDFAFGEGWV